MSVVEIREGCSAQHDAPVAQQQTSFAERIRQIWPLCVVGLGLVATVGWMALLSWMLYRAILLLT